MSVYPVERPWADRVAVEGRVAEQARMSARDRWDELTSWETVCVNVTRDATAGEGWEPDTAEQWQELRDLHRDEHAREAQRLREADALVDEDMAASRLAVMTPAERGDL